MCPLPEISVITACYNHGRFIGDMIDSILAQTLKKFELIIVNDGSTDTTTAELDKWDHPQIKVLHTENQGPSAARNLAIRHARSEIIFNIDADDKAAPELLEKVYGFTVSHPDWSIIYTDLEYFGAKKAPYVLEDYSLNTILYKNVIGSQSFFRKSDWQRVGGYSENLVHGLEDWDFWLSIIELGGQVYKIPEPLVYYRQYKNPSDCRSGRLRLKPRKSRKTILAIFHRHIDLYQREPDVFKYYLNLEKKWAGQNKIIQRLKDIYISVEIRKNYND